MNATVKTTCPYCGVGCGVQAKPRPDGQVDIAGDPDHPSNFGRLCSKGAALGETLDLDGRLLYPEIGGARVGWDAALDAVAGGLRRVIDRHGPDAVAFYVSGQLLTEDYYVANKLMKGFIGSANIDTNSRLCMSSTVAGYKRAFGADAMPCSYEDLEQARLIVLVGSNAAWCHPVLYQRIAQAKRDNPELKVVVIDPRQTATTEIADLHLALRAGTEIVLFNGLLTFLELQGEQNLPFVMHCTEGLDQAMQAARAGVPDIGRVADACDLRPEDVAELFRLFARTERVVTLFSQGVNQSSCGSDKVNAIINCHLYTGRIGRPGMGPFSLTGQTNAMGGREVGGMATTLAAHMDFSAPDIERVARFWGAPNIATRPGLKAVDLFEAVHEGRVRAVWIMGTNPVVSMPEADRVRAALQRCELVVVSDVMRNTDTTACAHILLPALAWGEKDGTVTNSERRISRQRAFLPAPGEARADWWIICQVARRLGHPGFDYASSHEIFLEHAALSAFENHGSRDFDLSGLARLSRHGYDELTPVPWPVRGSARGGSARLFGDGRFFTPDRRARFIAVRSRTPAHAVSEEYPLALNTGRVRDQWHTMTRTGKSPRLAEHCPEPYVEVHPEDAMRYGIRSGGLARVHSRFGEIIVRALVSDTQRTGSVFVPMHWNAQFAGSARVGALVNADCDPLSGQPELKHTPVAITPYIPAWHGFLISRRALDLHDARYWTRATGKGFFRYELAGEQVPGVWPAWARGHLCAPDEAVNWVEYLDVAARRYRGVRLVGSRVESCIFIAPTHELPPRNWLAQLFMQESLTRDERQSLLSGQPPGNRPDCGRIVCSCFGVGEHTLRQAIREQGLRAPEEIGRACKAGTNCGSCIPELKALLESA